MTGKWKIKGIPRSGWKCIDIQDLGKPSLLCQMCEHEKIRFAHYMQHQNYREVLIAGCICAGNMEGDLARAKERDAFMKSRMNKRKNWLSKKWKTSKKGNQYIKSGGFIVVLKKDNVLWSAYVKNENEGFYKWSSRKSADINEMKLAAFDCLTGVLADKQKEKIQTVEKYLPAPVTVKPALIPDFSKLKIIDNESREIQCEIIQHELFETSDDEQVFTNEQKNIFEFIKSGAGHGIIDAVAGDGKTTTIMECAKYVKDKTSVLFCAFNKSIQAEISGRFNKKGLNMVTVKTIHALGLNMLNDYNTTGKKIIPEENKYRTILNKDIELQNEMQEYVNELLLINGYETEETESRKQFAVRDILYKFKDRLLDINQKIRATLTPLDLESFKKLAEHFNYFTGEEMQGKTFNREIEIYFECSKILLYAGNALAKESLIIDFTDMLYLPFIWNLRAAKTYSFLFIDECQDLSKSQLAVVLKYCSKEGRILAVGDPYQSIYGFAGADIASFTRIKDTINAKPLPLTVCFRCPPNIVNLASGIRHDISAKKREQGIIEEITFNQITKKAKENDLIISRYREPVLSLVFEFINIKKQVQIHKDEVYDIIDELKILFKQEERSEIISEDNGGFEIIKETVTGRWNFIIEKESRKLANSSEKRIFIQTKTDYLNNRMEFLHKRYMQWKDSCPSINDILHKIREYMSASGNCIKLSTIHRAKGLEAQRVFILNFDELPHFKPSQKHWESLQEKNLKYVAITRAMKELYLVKSEKKNVIQKEASLFDEFIIK